MVKRPILIAVLMLAAVLGFAQQSWEGLATVARFGQFPAGLYGASNLVSPGTLVSVRNLETDETERIIITDGVSQPGVFIVLSPEAAATLDISGSGATRVRLTTIATEGPPVDTASEQAFHPDPDINPAAGIPLDARIADLERTPTPNQAEFSEPAVEPAPETLPPPEAEPPTEQEPQVGTTEATGPPAALPTTEPLAVEAVTAPVPPAVGPRRSGIAAGVARTQVGRAQETFERPEAAFSTEEPGPAPEVRAVVREPVIGPPEVASAGIAEPEKASEEIPTVAVVPEAPSEAEPAITGPSGGAESTATAPTVAEPASPVRSETRDGVAPAQSEPNPIEEAISEAVHRIPVRDHFPPPVGESSDLGFAGLGRPTGTEKIERPLAVAQAPPVDRPELAGLAPLEAAVPDLPVALAYATLPPEDLPDGGIFASREPPRKPVSVTTLPDARAEDEDRPSVADLPRYSATEAALTPGALAEASPAPELTAATDAVQAVVPPQESLVPVLAEATVLEAERTQLTDVGPAEPPRVPEVISVLPEATAGPREGADVSDVGPAGIPAVPDLDATLAEASVVPAESPGEDAVGPLGSPPVVIDGHLAEAAPGEAERPEESLASTNPVAEGLPPTMVPGAEPVAGEAEVLAADEGIATPSDIPPDALLTLEPADFRPPEYSGPDEGSLAARESPAEEPLSVAALESPEADHARQVIAPTAELPPSAAEIASTEPAGEPAPEPVRVPAASGVETPSLPIVAELVDRNFYLQIGAYTAVDTARVAVDALGATYPMVVLPSVRDDTTVYRVLVGPLEQDETGTLLLWLRAKGYRDTFIRSGTEL